MIEVVYSTQHKIVPTIIGGILVVLFLIICLTEGMERVKQGEKFFPKPEPLFIPDYDKVKLWGTLILFIAYIYALEIVGFTVTSMVFVLLFNLLYAGLEKSAVIKSVIISVVGSLFISLLFGKVFNITLPSGFCTITFVDLALTIY